MAPVLRLVELARATDVGRLRGHNEDRYLDLPPLLAVADGMGGAQAGEVASAIAVTTMARIADGTLALGDVRTAVEEANREIRRTAAANPSQAGMGTTVTAALLEGGTLNLVHVGDSRAYVVRDGGLIRLTDDHSLVEELVKRGDITPEEADRHPQRNVITRALGAEPEVEVDVVTAELRDGDILLLCTDGLTTYVKEARVLAAIEAAASLDEAAAALVDLANGVGGVDNVTVVLGRIGMAEEDAPIAGAEPPTWDEVGASVEAAPAPRSDPVTMVGAIPPELMAAAAAAEADRGAARAGDGEPLQGDEALAEPARESAPAMRSRARQDAAPQRAPRAVLEQVPRRRSRRAPILIGFVVVVALLAGAAAWVSSRTYFVGQADGRVQVFHGYPASPAGLDLFGSWQSTGLEGDLVSRIPGDLLDRDARGQGEAVALAARLVWRYGLPAVPALTAPVQGPVRPPAAPPSPQPPGATPPAAQPPAQQPAPPAVQPAAPPPTPVPNP